MIRYFIPPLFFFGTIHAFERPIPMVDKTPVEIDPGFFGTKFKQDGKVIKPNSMFQVLSGYPESQPYASSAKGFMYAGIPFAAAGGFIIGYTAVQPMVGGEFNAPFFFAGVGSAAVGIIFGKISEKKLVHAVEAYNGVLGKTTLQWDWTPTRRGLAVTTRF